MAKPRGPNRNFPPLRLAEALKVARVIQDEASGMPINRLTLAQVLKTTPSSSVFQQLVASSRFYGLTEGGINSPDYKLTKIGEQATGAGVPERSSALKQAVLNVAPFKTFFETFSGKKVPGGPAMRDFLINSAAVPATHAEACAAQILDDAATAGLIRTIGSAPWVDLDGVPSDPSEDHDEATEALDTEDVVEELQDDVPPVLPPTPEQPATPQAIFVAGRKGKSLTQLTKILDEYKIPYLLAEDEPNVGRPISIKVAETMTKCGAAIIVFTPDEELRNLKDEPVWRPSQNIVHELGAAGMQYGNRIVIFREETVDLAANYNDIGHITFKDGELNAKAIELFRELIAFGIVTMTVGGAAA